VLGAPVDQWERMKGEIARGAADGLPDPPDLGTGPRRPVLKVHARFVHG
jgi:hypothetical protein